MDFLKFFSILALLGGTSLLHAEYGEEIDPRLQLMEQQKRQLCGSTEEFIKALKFLHTTKDVTFAEDASRKIAEVVSSGCDGAAGRFAQVITLLKTVGLSDRKALEMSLEFAAQPPDVQKNFSEIFNRTFLNEFFDYEYPLAAALAYELSRDYHGDPVQVRDDFIDLVRFCKDGKNLDLPMKMCAEYTVKLARLTQYHPQGIREPFKALFKDLRTKPEFSLDVKKALEVSYNVLQSGPRATENFFSAYAFANKKEGLDYNRQQAMAFALRMASRSYLGEHPPIVPGITSYKELTRAATP